MSNIKFNILTRTSGRANYFKKCCESLDRQTFKDFIHIVGTDDFDSIQYIKDSGRNPILMDPIRRDSRILHPVMSSPYNLYFNIMYNYVVDGFIIFLDDDDEFSSDYSLEIMAELLGKQKSISETLLFWQVLFQGKRLIPNAFDGRFLYPTNVSGIGFTFHSKYIFAAQWDQFKESDFRVAHKLSLIIPNNQGLTLTLTQTQRTDSMGGLGFRDDIKV